MGTHALIASQTTAAALFHLFLAAAGAAASVLWGAASSENSRGDATSHTSAQSFLHLCTSDMRRCGHTHPASPPARNAQLVILS